MNFKRKFLAEVFGISNILGILGVGRGGYEAFTWGCEYPDEMEFLIVGHSSFKTNGYRYITSKALINLIESSDAYLNSVYSDQLSKLMFSINSLIYAQLFSKKSLQKFTQEELDILMDTFVEENSTDDIYDFKYRTDAALNYDVEDKLSNIKAKTLIVCASQDGYYSPEFDMLPLKDKIENVEIYIFDDQEFVYKDDNSLFVTPFREFLEEFKE